MRPLIAILLLLTAAASTAVVLTRSPRRQVFAMSANGLVLSVLFETLCAPDVALAEIVIGGVALPLLFFVVLASARMARSPGSRV
jgi:uncharacterized MnhB-related membrane protein